MDGILSMVLLVLLIILGIIYCFGGYKYLKVMILIYALFAGCMFTHNLLSAVAPDLGIWIWIISIAVGLILGALAFFFVKFSIFIAGGIMGLALFAIVRQYNAAYFNGLDSIYVFLIGLAFFVILGAITLVAKKHLIIIATAIFGSYSFVYAAGILIGLLFQPELLRAATVRTATSVLAPASIFNSAPTWAMMLPIVVFTVAGIIAQYKSTARRKK